MSFGVITPSLVIHGTCVNRVRGRRGTGQRGSAFEGPEGFPRGGCSVLEEC